MIAAVQVIVDALLLDCMAMVVSRELPNIQTRHFIQQQDYLIPHLAITIREGKDRDSVLRFFASTNFLIITNNKDTNVSRPVSGVQ